MCRCPPGWSGISCGIAVKCEVLQCKNENEVCSLKKAKFSEDNKALLVPEYQAVCSCPEGKYQILTTNRISLKNLSIYRIWLHFKLEHFPWILPDMHSKQGCLRIVISNGFILPMPRRQNRQILSKWLERVSWFSLLAWKVS